MEELITLLISLAEIILGVWFLVDMFSGVC